MAPGSRQSGENAAGSEDAPQFDLAEVARRSNEGRSTIQLRVKQGELAAEKVSGRWLVRPSELQRYLASRNLGSVQVKAEAESTLGYTQQLRHRS